MAKETEELLATARKRFQQDADDERQIREQAKIDLRFEAGEQWDEAIKQARIKAGRPALTFPRCHTFVQQVSNEVRQNKPQIKYVPAEEGDKATAEIFEGLARHIQYSSDAQVAYETALEYAAGGSFGYYRFLTDYCDDESFDQEIKIVPVLDPFAVYGVLIPACFGIKPDHAFVVEDMPLEAYKAKYPDSELCSIGFAEGSKLYDGWVGTETVRVAEYWVVTEKSEKKTQGDKSRTISKKTVKCYKINGAEILEENEWAGSCIPIVPVLGKSRIIDGKPVISSVIRFQRDPQQLINIYKSRIAETLGTAPIQPYMVVEGQIEGHEREWETLNSSMRPYLVHTGHDANGNPVGHPERMVYEAPINALSSAAAQEIDDMKATSGIYDASMGSHGNETSGVAIQRRKQQSDITNLHFMDNLERAFKEGGTMLAELIPVHYDTERIIRILGEDEVAKLVKINAPTEHNGQQQHFKIGGDGVGKYDIIVTMGRSFSTKRAESFDMMQQVMQSAPQQFPMWADIFFKNSDMAGADQLAERFKKMLPPNLQDDQQGDPKAMLQQAAGKIQQVQQEAQQMHAYAQQLETERDDLKAREEAKVIDNQAKMAIEQMKIEAQITIAEIGAKAQETSLRLKLEQDMLSQLHSSAHEVATQSMNQAHAADMQGQQQEYDAQMSQQQAEQAQAAQQAQGGAE